MLKKKPGGVTGRFLGLVAQWGTAGGEGVEVSAPSQPMWHKGVSFAVPPGWEPCSRARSVFAPHGLGFPTSWESPVKV